MSDTGYDVIIRGGIVVTAADSSVCDLGIRDGRIVAHGEDLMNDAGGGTKVIDATGKYVLPGGIDAHVHLDESAVRDIALADNFLTGTRSAICGGTTTVLSFAAQEPGRTIRAVVDEYHDRVRGTAYTDYGFHIILTDPNPQVLGQDLPALVADGYTSVKVYMTYEGYVLDDHQILNVFGACKEHGALPMVHAENDCCIHWLRAQALDNGDVSMGAHGRIAPMPVEREATHRAISLAEVVGTPILIVHMSAGDAVEQLGWAQRRNMPIHGETCPQYLFLTQADMDRPGTEGAKYICSPPPRSEADQQVLWDSLCRGGSGNGGRIDIYSSDHCPYTYAGDGGKLNAGPNPAFHEVPPGLPGIELRLPLLFSEGVMKGRMDINRFVAVTATNPAKLYGLYPKKGNLSVGADADITIWDPEREVTVRHEDLHDNVDYTPYEGLSLQGWPVMTLLRGEVVWNDGALTDAEPGGTFIPRQRFCHPSGL